MRVVPGSSWLLNLDILATLTHAVLLFLCSFVPWCSRDWSMDSQIRYIRVVSGPAGRESMLVGLRNGQVFRIFVNNSFPNFILKQQVSIRCLDLSLRSVPSFVGNYKRDKAVKPIVVGANYKVAGLL